MLLSLSRGWTIIGGLKDGEADGLMVTVGTDAERGIEGGPGGGETIRGMGRIGGGVLLTILAAMLAGEWPVGVLRTGTTWEKICESFKGANRGLREGSVRRKVASTPVSET